MWTERPGDGRTYARSARTRRPRPKLKWPAPGTETRIFGTARTVLPQDLRNALRQQRGAAGVVRDHLQGRCRPRGTRSARLQRPRCSRRAPHRPTREPRDASRVRDRGNRKGELLERMDGAAKTIADRIATEVGPHVANSIGAGSAEAIAARIGDLVATRVAEALGGDAGEQVAAAIAKKVGQQVGEPRWKRGKRGAPAGGWRRNGSEGRSAATESPALAVAAGAGAEGADTAGDADAAQGSEAPSATEHASELHAATKTPAPTEAGADAVNGSGTGDSASTGEPSAQAAATGNNGAAGGDTGEDVAGADGGPHARAGTEGSTSGTRPRSTGSTSETAAAPGPDAARSGARMSHDGSSPGGPSTSICETVCSTLCAATTRAWACSCSASCW